MLDLIWLIWLMDWLIDRLIDRSIIPAYMLIDRSIDRLISIYAGMCSLCMCAVVCHVCISFISRALTSGSRRIAAVLFAEWTLKLPPHLPRSSQTQSSVADITVYFSLDNFLCNLHIVCRQPLFSRAFCFLGYVAVIPAAPLLLLMCHVLKNGPFVFAHKLTTL